MIVSPDPDSKTSPPPELLHAAREWIWRHSRQPNGDRWLSTRPTLTAGDDPNHLDWAAENLLRDLAPWLAVPPSDEDDDCGHHSWAGLMRLLDEHWPDDIFPTRYQDDPKRGAGPRIVSLMRWVDELRAKVARVVALADELEAFDPEPEDEDEVEWTNGHRWGFTVAVQRIRAALDKS